MEFPEPVIRVAIEPKTKAGQRRCSVALSKLAEEDPTFKTYTDEETGQDHHRRHGRAAPGDNRRQAAARVQGRGQRRQAPGLLQGDHHQGPPPSIRASCARPAAAASSRTSSSPSEPNESGKGYEFVDDIHGGAIPKEYIPCVDQGIQGAMLAGILGGYQVVDVKATLIDGSFHEVDSSENALKYAQHGVQGGHGPRPAPLCSSPS